jgi:hypothetical protein
MQHIIQFGGRSKVQQGLKPIPSIPAFIGPAKAVPLLQN